MRIVWDEPKRLANIASHGMDFADLDETFFESSVIVPTKFGRLAAIGRHHRRIILVVFVALGSQGLSVISSDRRAERNGDRWVSSGNHTSRAMAIPERTGTTFKVPN